MCRAPYRSNKKVPLENVTKQFCKLRAFRTLHTFVSGLCSGRCFPCIATTVSELAGLQTEVKNKSGLSTFHTITIVSWYIRYTFGSLGNSKAELSSSLLSRCSSELLLLLYLAAQSTSPLVEVFDSEFAEATSCRDVCNIRSWGLQCTAGILSPYCEFGYIQIWTHFCKQKITSVVVWHVLNVPWILFPWESNEHTTGFPFLFCSDVPLQDSPAVCLYLLVVHCQQMLDHPPFLRYVLCSVYFLSPGLP